MLSGAAIALAIVLAGGAWGLSRAAGGAGHVLIAPAAQIPYCPTTVPALGPRDVRGASSRLLPFTPAEVHLCGYDDAGVFQTASGTKDPAVLARLTAYLATFGRPDTSRDCAPPTRRVTFYAVFQHQDGPSITLSYRPEACATADNGSYHGQAGALPPPPGSPALDGDPFVELMDAAPVTLQCPGEAAIPAYSPSEAQPETRAGLISFVPTSMLICRYDKAGTAASPGMGRLLYEEADAAPQDDRYLADEIDSFAPLWPGGARSCPPSDGSGYELRFGDGLHRATLFLSRTGCQVLSDGRAIPRPAGAPILAQFQVPPRLYDWIRSAQGDRTWPTPAPLITP